MFEDSSYKTQALKKPMIEGPFPSKTVTVESGENLNEYSVMGEVKKTTIAQAYSGTGDGAMTGLAYDTEAIPGDYIVECVEAIADSGRFKVIDPKGNRLDDAVVGTAYDNGHLEFSIADGVDFIVGDKFTITISAPATETFKQSVATAKDGSEKPVGILAEKVDASAADKKGLMYTGGTWGTNGLEFGSGHSYATAYDSLKENGINLRESTQ